MSRLMDIKLRRGTAAAWTAANPVLDSGEPGWETDTRRLKFGDGSTTWVNLPYFASGGGAGSTELIYDYTVTGSDKASIDTGSDTAQAGSNDWTNGDTLEVYIYARTDEATTGSIFDVTLNNDTGSNYIRQSHSGNNTATTAAYQSAMASWQLVCPGSSSVASVFGMYEIIIPNYAGTVGYKEARASSVRPTTTGAASEIDTHALAYHSTTAVSRLKIIPDTAAKKFVVGTRILIYKRRNIGYVAPAGATELIYKYTVTGSDKASIDTGSDTAQAGSNDWTNGDMLEVVIMGRTDEAAVNSTVSIQFNGDTSTANYIYELVRGNNTSASAVRNLTIPGVQIPIFAGASHASGQPSMTTIQIPAYAQTNFNKIMTMLNGAPDVTTAGSNYVEAEVATWLSTAAITRLAAVISSGSSQKFKVGTTILIYKRIAQAGLTTTNSVDGGSA